MVTQALLSLAIATGSVSSERSGSSAVVENRTIELTQTVTLHDVPEGTRQLRIWVPIPSDGQWQRVTNRSVTAAPGQWRLERQLEGRGEFLYVEVDHPPAGDASVVVNCTIERQGVYFPLQSIEVASSEYQAQLFREHLASDAPRMAVDHRIKAMADEICGDETDPARQAVMLLRGVANAVNHYSKDSSLPSCGIGSASNCLQQGGGCCTDLHSLFVALGRARGIPTRIQFGYRALDSRAGQTVDPSYRCWVEFFIPGTGWIPTDIVASDGAEDSSEYLWGSLSATRVWLWEGRSFELSPPTVAGRVHTMLCGWAEIDGKPVDVLPADDGTPSQLRRTIHFNVISADRTPKTARLPE